MSKRIVRRSYFNDPDLVQAMKIVRRIIETEGDCASRSYLNQRVGEVIGYGLGMSKLDTMVLSKAIKAVPGARRGFPIVYVKGDAWHRVWVECNAERMTFDTLKDMNEHRGRSLFAM